MKVVIAPNALKESLTATEAARAMARGVVRAIPGADTALVPVADGGDGLCEVIEAAHETRRMRCTVGGPLGDPVEAFWLHVPATGVAFIEMATASGLALLDTSARDPMRASTHGTGELIAAALDAGARRIIVGVGGSATTDGGTGMAAALGARFLDAGGEPIPPGGGGLAALERIDLSDLHPGIAEASIEVLCDVDNPLTGPRGAARVYAPQKGADGHQVEQLEQGLTHYARIVERDLGISIADRPGAGAAGGLAAGLEVFLGATLRPGAEVILELVDFTSHLAGADLVLTSEGALDGQTAHGKAPAAVASAAQAAGVPVIAVAGSVGDDRAPLQDAGIIAAFSLCPGPVALEEAISSAAALIEQTCADVAATFAAGMRSTAEKRRHELPADQ